MSVRIRPEVFKLKGYMNNNRFFSFAITGGPCGGKSEFLKVGKPYLEKTGAVVGIRPEMATLFTNSGFSPVHNKWKSDILLFQEYIINSNIILEDMYHDLLHELDTESPLILLCDRGILDVKAYMSDEQFQDILLGFNHYNYTNVLERYTAVIHMVSTAIGKEELYSCENNLARTETLEEAKEADLRTEFAWKDHPRFYKIDNSTDWEQKKQRALDIITNIVYGSN